MNFLYIINCSVTVDHFKEIIIKIRKRKKMSDVADKKIDVKILPL